MDVKLHANATTTPRTRAYIQSSGSPVAVLAAELGVSETTIRRWRGRREVVDHSHVPKQLSTSLSDLEQQLVCDLRRMLALPLDDITEVMHRCVNAKLSRSAIFRCLKRRGLNRLPSPQSTPSGRFEQTEAGFVHIDVKHLPALNRQKAYAFVAIERATRYVYLEVHADRSAKTAAAFLQRFLVAFPIKVHTLLSDNGSEFTDRFAVDMKGKPEGKPSGHHPVDRLCAAHGIDHRLSRPFHPQTNGMVERFNRRLAEVLRAAQPNGRNQGKNKFDTHAQRNAYLRRFVDNYNRTRLKCLAYAAPAQALANLAEQHTCAGMTPVGGRSGAP
ncbi:MAG TPA: IS481 family transposase [Devosia sp.]